MRLKAKPISYFLRIIVICLLLWGVVEINKEQRSLLVKWREHPLSVANLLTEPLPHTNKGRSLQGQKEGIEEVDQSDNVSSLAPNKIPYYKSKFCAIVTFLLLSVLLIGGYYYSQHYHPSEHLEDEGLESLPKKVERLFTHLSHSVEEEPTYRVPYTAPDANKRTINQEQEDRKPPSALPLITPKAQNKCATAPIVDLNIAIDPVVVTLEVDQNRPSSPISPLTDDATDDASSTFSPRISPIPVGLQKKSRRSISLDTSLSELSRLSRVSMTDFFPNLEEQKLVSDDESNSTINPRPFTPKGGALSDTDSGTIGAYNDKSMFSTLPPKKRASLERLRGGKPALANDLASLRTLTRHIEKVTVCPRSRTSSQVLSVLMGTRERLVGKISTPLPDEDPSHTEDDQGSERSANSSMAPTPESYDGKLQGNLLLPDQASEEYFENPFELFPVKKRGSEGLGQQSLTRRNSYSTPTASRRNSPIPSRRGSLYRVVPESSNDSPPLLPRARTIDPVKPKRSCEQIDPQLTIGERIRLSNHQFYISLLREKKAVEARPSKPEVPKEDYAPLRVLDALAFTLAQYKKRLPKVALKPSPIHLPASAPTHQLTPIGEDEEEVGFVILDHGTPSSCSLSVPP